MIDEKLMEVPLDIVGRDAVVEELGAILERFGDHVALTL